MATTSPAPGAEITMVSTDMLQLDDRNPRFTDIDDSSQEALINKMWREFSVDELMWSISENGFFQFEPLIAEPDSQQSGRFIVVEGNRRLAAVKLLLDQELRRRLKATSGIPRVTAARKAELTELPVVVNSRSGVWQYLGFKHVNGPQTWSAESKAKYVAYVHNELGISLSDIADTIGDRHSTVRRFYRGLMVLNQAEKQRLWSRDDRVKARFAFSHLYTILAYENTQTFLGLEESKSYRKDPIKKSRQGELTDLLVWLYGSKEREAEPVVQTQNPDLRRLDEVLSNSDGIAALRQGLDLSVSIEITRGDEKLFRSALVEAKQAVEHAVSKVTNGYSGEPDLLDRAHEIDRLVSLLLRQMEDTQLDEPGPHGRRGASSRSSR